MHLVNEAALTANVLSCAELASAGLSVGSLTLIGAALLMRIFLIVLFTVVQWASNQFEDRCLKASMTT